MLHILVIHEGQRCLFGVLIFVAFDWSFVTQNGPFFGWTWEPLLVSFAWAASVGVTMISVVKFGGIVANMAISLEITVTYIGAAAFLGSPVRVVYEVFLLMSLVSTVVAYNYLTLDIERALKKDKDDRNAKKVMAQLNSMRTLPKSGF